MSAPLLAELQQRITQATQDLAQAERGLATALEAVRQTDRSNKVMISEPLEAAFANVRSAKAALAALATEQS